MKAYIGPYRNWIGPFQIANLLKFLGANEDQQHSAGEWLNDTWVRKACEWVDEKKHRKINIRIDDYDTWNVNSTLALITLPLLKKFRENLHGACGSMPAFEMVSHHGRQECFPFYAEGDDAAWKEGQKQWEEVLDKMIWSFEQLLNDNWEDQYWSVKPEIDWKASKENKDPDKVSHELIWKEKGICDWEGMRKHEERIQEGLDLFGKHYKSLWD